MCLPDTRSGSFRKGSTHCIIGRQFRIEGYADEVTTEWFESQQQSHAFVLIRSYAYSMIGSILMSLQSSGLELTALAMVHLNDAEVRQFGVMCESADCPTVVQGMTADASVALKLFGEDAIARCSRLIESVEAPSDGRCMHDRLVYVSKSPVHAEREFSFFFGPSRFARTAIFRHCALCIVKPHAVNPHSGAVIDAILKEDFEISALQLTTLSLPQVRNLLEVYKGVISDFSETCTELASGASLLIQVRQQEVVSKLRRLVGPLDPAIAKQVAPASLRARFGLDRARNAVHCTDLEDDGVRECEYFFK